MKNRYNVFVVVRNGGFFGQRWGYSYEVEARDENVALIEGIDRHHENVEGFADLLRQKILKVNVELA